MISGTKVFITPDQLSKVVAKTDIKAEDFALLIGIQADRVPAIISGEIVDSYFLEKWEAYQNLKSSILKFDKGVLEKIITQSFSAIGSY